MDDEFLEVAARAMRKFADDGGYLPADQWIQATIASALVSIATSLNEMKVWG